MNTRNKKYSKEVETKPKGKKNETRKRERSREKEISKKEENSVKNDQTKQETINTNANELNRISLMSSFKVLLENFVEKEIDQIYKKGDEEITFSATNGTFTYTFNLKDKTSLEQLTQKIMSSGFYKKKEIKFFINNEEMINQDAPNENKHISDDNKNKIVYNIREITVENIPASLTNEKLYELFFIFGDICNIQILKNEKKALIMFKYCTSAEKAYKKMNSDKHQTKNITVKLSDPAERPDIEGDEENSQERNEGKVIYMKFKDSDSVLRKEDLKSLLKRYGLITKIFIKKEGKSYYLEFSSPSSAHDVIRDFNNLNLPKEFKNVVQIDYAFNKNVDKKFGLDYQQTETKIDENNEQVNNTQDVAVLNSTTEIQEINPNKLWQVYFDQTYQRNFYFNPFYNESVWDLPEGAELNPNQYSNYYYDPNANEPETQEISNEAAKTENLNERVEQAHYDEEAWEADELTEKIIWDKMKEQQLKEWIKRPARQQVTDTRKDTGYIEGNYDYNIWYDKYLTDRKEEKEKVPALYRCNPALDTGFTKADLQEKEGGAFFCMFFAKGCCTEGVNCRYYHRVPTKEDAEKIENLRDVFGRSRFAVHRVDMGGVGTFTKECRTLYVTDLKTVESVNPNKEMMRIIYENFSPWGEIEDVNYIPSKAACFIRYAHRCFAEFGKEAMIGQALVGEEILSVRWAYNDPNPMNKKRIEKEHENRFLSAYQRKQDNLDKLRQQNSLNPIPNTDYRGFYSNKNNPHAYSSGYGYDSYEEANIRRDTSNQPVDNYSKLAKTLEMIDREFK